MRTIPKPDLKVRDVFLDCISTVLNAVHKQQLLDCIDIVELAELDFDNKVMLMKFIKYPSNSPYSVLLEKKR
jgi:hypothetical protein